MEDAEIEGRLQAFGSFSTVLTVIRPIGDMIVTHDAVLAYAPVFNLVRREGQLLPNRHGAVAF